MFRTLILATAILTGCQTVSEYECKRLDLEACTVAKMIVLYKAESAASPIRTHIRDRLQRLGYRVFYDAQTRQLTLVKDY